MHILHDAVMTGRSCMAATRTAKSAKSHIQCKQRDRESSHSTHEFSCILIIHMYGEIVKYRSGQVQHRWYMQSTDMVCTMRTS